MCVPLPESGLSGELSSYGIGNCKEAERETKTQAHETLIEAGITEKQ